MKNLVDENIPKMTVRALIEANHDVLDVLDVRGTPQEGFRDEQLWQLAQSDARLLVSTDKGFAHRRFETHHGILIVILHQPNRQKIHERVLKALAQFDESEWRKQLVIMRDVVQSLYPPREIL